MAPLTSPVLVVGARSDIGRALARRYAAAGCDVILAARNATSLEADRIDIELRHQRSASLAECDVTDADPDRFFAALPQPPGTVIMVAGLLGDQAESAADTGAAAKVMATNYTGPALFLLAAARALQARGGGCIIGVSSVAGDRGRGSNYVYGSAKAGLTAFLSGLRNSLAGAGVQVITVKPGFVDTQMTAGMNLPKPFTAQPDEVAQAVLRAQQRGVDVVYVRPIWRLIMLIITCIPEPVFKRLRL
ncbi:MAG TPA: SDR family oxidoreductase [Phenylobacterium sp.]|nr:SDR family oxidoreductase [Phenylobacterium sp.]